MSLHYLLDTNICIYIIKKNPTVLKKLEPIHVGEAGMSVITEGELLYGAEKSTHPIKTKKMLEEFSRLILPQPLSILVSEHYGKIRSFLEKKGKTIGANDLWIAAHAITLNVTLITNNERKFLRIPHLKVQNWV